MKSGIGVSEKLATDWTLFLASCVSPASPPRKRTAPARLIARKVKATGKPRNNRTGEPPSMTHAAACHDIRAALRSTGRHCVVARRVLAERQPTHAKQHLDSQQYKRNWQRGQDPP